MTHILRNSVDDLEFLRSLRDGDIVTMVDPGPEHLDEGLYVGVPVKIVTVEGCAESRDVFLFIEGKKTGIPIGCFPERVTTGPPPRQMELF